MFQFEGNNYEKSALSLFFITALFFIRIAGAGETEYKDKQIEELSKKFFFYSNVDGKQALKLITEEEAKPYAEEADTCDNNVAKLIVPGAALSIPGTPLILAFLDCPIWNDCENDSIVSLFNRNAMNAPLCFSRLILMYSHGYYYYGGIRSLEVREAKDKAFYVVVKLSGGDGGDSWVSLAFLHIDMNCRIRVLSKLLSGYTVNCDSDECGGDEIEYRFINKKTVEVTTKQIVFTNDVEKKVNTSRKKYDLEELYDNPGKGLFPSIAEKAVAALTSNGDVHAKDEDGTTPLSGPSPMKKGQK